VLTTLGDVTGPTRESHNDLKVLDGSIWFWMKAGIGFTLGAGIVTVVSQVLWWLFLANLITGIGRALAHR